MAESGSVPAAPLREPFPHCPLCGHGESARIVTADAGLYPHWCEPLPRDFNWMRCGRCQHVFTEHHWTAAGLEILLGRVHATQKAGQTPLDAQRAVWAPVIQNVVNHLEPPQRLFSERPVWLDVGCGDGALVMTADEFGFDSVGLDLREETVAALAAQGYRCLHGDLMRVAAEGGLDVLSMMDVLEHMPYPVPAVRRARELLKPGGLLLLSCPNRDAASWRQMDRTRSNPYWIELEHCHNFSRSSLVTLARECGFVPLHYDVSRRYKAGMDLLFRRGAE